jgi:hypothetical protein
LALAIVAANSWSRHRSKRSESIHNILHKGPHHHGSLPFADRCQLVSIPTWCARFDTEALLGPVQVLYGATVLETRMHVERGCIYPALIVTSCYRQPVRLRSVARPLLRRGSLSRLRGHDTNDTAPELLTQTLLGNIATSSPWNKDVAASSHASHEHPISSKLPQW